MLFAYVDLAEVYLAFWEASGKQAEYQESARRACAALRSAVRFLPVGQASALRLQGRFDWLTGDHSRAGQQWTKALALAERLVIPFEQAMSHYEIGRHFTQQDPARK